MVTITVQVVLANMTEIRTKPKKQTISKNKYSGYQLKAGHSVKSGNCVSRRKLFIAGAFAEFGDLRTRTFVPA
ncbi:MAG: hypothetical protein D3922_16200 [Candidatus Electrothrix sp. AR1]|nr:hypothetical protein [Candidatus Electrothrix sp. AR1]